MDIAFPQYEAAAVFFFWARDMWTCYKENIFTSKYFVVVMRGLRLLWYYDIFLIFYTQFVCFNLPEIKIRFFCSTYVCVDPSTPNYIT